jgi:two-component system sensor histidine kinase QseC
MDIQKPHSLQNRLVLSLVISLLLTLGGTGLLSYFITQHESEEIFGARLATSARVFDVLIAQKVATATLTHPIVIELPKELELPAGEEQTILGHRYENKIAFQVWSDDGRLLVKSASAPDTAFSQLKSGFAESSIENKRWQVFTLRSDSGWVQVAEKDDIREELADDLSFALTTPLLVGSLVLLALAYGVVRVGLSSLEQLARHIGQRGPDSLSAIELKDPPREVSTVTSAMNQLLQRMRASREREIRFTDAAAHELRTPLAALKVHADNLRQAETPQQRDQSLQQLLKSLNRAQRLSEQLLALSAVQSEARLEPEEPIDLPSLLADVIGELEPAMSRKQQTIEAHGLDALAQGRLRGQALKLHRMLSNLLDNAIRYGDAGSTHTIAVSLSGQHVDISLSSAGDPIPQDMRRRIVEPYVRVLGSKVEGTGLGLAIVKEIVDQHGGELLVEPDASRRINTLTVRLPLD